MGRTTFIRPIKATAAYERAFFEELFNELEYANFTEVNVYLPAAGSATRPPITPADFLKLTDKVDGVYIAAVNKLNPGDMLDFVVTRRGPTATFPNVRWPEGLRHRAFASVTSFDAPRPYALTGHFQGFAQEHADETPGAHPFFPLSYLFFLALEAGSLITARRFVNQWTFGWPPIIDVLQIVFVIVSLVLVTTASRGVVMHEPRSGLSVLRNLHREPYRSNPFVIISYTIVGGTIAAVIAGLILNAIVKQRP